MPMLIEITYAVQPITHAYELCIGKGTVVEFSLFFNIYDPVHFTQHWPVLPETYCTSGCD